MNFDKQQDLENFRLTFYDPATRKRRKPGPGQVIAAYHMIQRGFPSVEAAFEWLGEFHESAGCPICGDKPITRMEYATARCERCRKTWRGVVAQRQMRQGQPPRYCDCQNLPEGEKHSEGWAYEIDEDDPDRRYVAKMLGGERVRCGTWERWLEAQPQKQSSGGSVRVVD